MSEIAANRHLVDRAEWLGWPRFQSLYDVYYPSMNTERGTIEGPVVLAEDTTLYGMLVGDGVVAHGVRLLLHGMITGDLRVDQGGEAVVFGMLCGSLENHGKVSIYGMVIGRVVDTDDGETTPHPGSIVSGTRH